MVHRYKQRAITISTVVCHCPLLAMTARV